MAKGVQKGPPFAFGPIGKSAYELLADLLMDFENDRPDENLRYSAPSPALFRLAALVGADDSTTQSAENPFGDGITFDRPKLSVVLGMWRAHRPGTRQHVHNAGAVNEISQRVSYLFSNGEALLLQRIWQVVTSLQRYFNLDPANLSQATDDRERVRASPRWQGTPLPSHIIPWLQEAIRLLAEEHPTWQMRSQFEPWLTKLSELDEKFPNFQPKVECKPGPMINEKAKWHVTGWNNDSSASKPVLVESTDTLPFRPLRRLASGLVPLLEAVGIWLPDSHGSTLDGRLLFWAWHVHNGTPPRLPSWEVTPETGAFKVIKSAIFKSVNPDGSAKVVSQYAITQYPSRLDSSEKQQPVLKELEEIRDAATGELVKSETDAVKKLRTSPLPPSPLPKGVTLLDAALVLEGLNDDDQLDSERRTAAVEMKIKWGKRRSLKKKLGTPIGKDRDDRQADLFDVVDLTNALIADKEGYRIVQIGDKEFVRRLRKCQREPFRPDFGT
ncbi:MAG: hypothetical protein NT013_19920 [Planctomycetia bacterium]|nr:hypothetical protein [Planctomycetia bacterium]